MLVLRQRAVGTEIPEMSSGFRKMLLAQHQEVSDLVI